jgi:amino acid transporter
MSAYLSLPVFLALYLGHRIWHHQDKWMYPVDEIDLQSGLEEVELEGECEGEKPVRKWVDILKSPFQ